MLSVVERALRTIPLLVFSFYPVPVFFPGGLSPNRPALGPAEVQPNAWAMP
jgi:hypothetical protein